MASDEKLVRRVLFWSILGPFLLSFTLLVNSLHVGLGACGIPFALVVGIFLCWRFGLKGLLFSLFCLVLSTVFCIWNAGPDQQFWQVGLAISTALGFIVTSLCFEEVEALVGHLQLESNCRLEGLWKLDEKARHQKERWTCERDELSMQLNVLKEELEEALKEKNLRESTAQRIREEVLEQHRQRETLLEELLETQHTLARREEEVRGLKGELEGLQATNSCSLSEEGAVKISEIERQLQESKKELSHYQAVLEGMEWKYLLEREDRERLEVELENVKKAHRERVAENLQKLNTLRAVCFQRKLDSEGKAEISGSLQQSQRELDREVRRVRGMYKQLQNQFEEKKQILHETRKEVFGKEGLLHDLRRQVEELRAEGLNREQRELEKLLEKAERENRQKEEEISALNSLVESLFDELGERGSA